MMLVSACGLPLKKLLELLNAGTMGSAFFKGIGNR